LIIIIIKFFFRFRR